MRRQNDPKLYPDLLSTPAWLNALVDNSPDIILVRDAWKRIIHWNKGAERILGFRKEEVIGRTALEIGFIHFTEREMTEIDVSLKNTGYWKANKKYFTRSGRSFYGAVTANVISLEQGLGEAVMFIIKDISQQKKLEDDLWKINEELEMKVFEKTIEIRKAESRFNAMVENNHEAFAMIDGSQRILYRSPAASRLTGWSDEEALQPGFLDRLIHPADKEKFYGFMKTAKDSPGRLIRTFYRIINKEGETRYHEGTLVNLLGENIGAIVSDVRDVTEIVWRQQELEKSRQKIEERERLLQLYIEHSPASIAMFDTEMNYLVVSQRWVKEFGLNGKKLIGRSHYEVFPEITEEWKQIHRECLGGATRKNDEELFVRADGTRTWLRWEVRPWYHSGGSIGGILIFSEDITKRKLDEESIALSETKYRSLIESIADGFVAVDRNWQFTYINKVAEQMLRKTAGELLGKNAWDEFPVMVGSAFYPGFQGAMKNRQYSVIEDFSIYLNHWVRVYIYPSEEGLSIFFKDITREKQSEQEILKSQERLQRAQKIAHMGHWEINFKTNISKWSDEAYRIYGLEPEDQNISFDEWLKWVHPDDLEQVTDAVERGKENWRGASFHHRIIRKDGSIRHLFAESRYETDEMGHPVSMYGIVYDITQLKTLEQELQNQQRQEQIKLTAAIIEAEEKERKAIGEELHDNVNQILAGIKILLSTIDTRSEKIRNVLSCSMENLQLAINENRKIAHERTSPDFEGLSLLESIGHLTESMLTNAGIQVDIVKTDFDEAKLKKEIKLTFYRIAQEQCTNIVKYSGAKKVSIVFTDTNDVMSMRISDNGRGADLSRQSGGIGLKNIKSRIGIYNGTVHVQTAPGKGFALEVAIDISPESR